MMKITDPGQWPFVEMGKSENLPAGTWCLALGHPLGCTGAKLTATLLHEMRRREVEYGICSMCIGGGMGAAAIFKRLG